MSSHKIYVKCRTEGCTTVESIYTGDKYTDLFPDGGEDSWEGAFIDATCFECLERSVAGRAS